MRPPRCRLAAYAVENELAQRCRQRPVIFPGAGVLAAAYAHVAVAGHGAARFVVSAVHAVARRFAPSVRHAVIGAVGVRLGGDTAVGRGVRLRRGLLLSASPQAASVTASISAAASAINRSVISVPPFPCLRRTRKTRSSRARCIRSFCRETRRSPDTFSLLRHLTLHFFAIRDMINNTGRREYIR